MIEQHVTSLGVSKELREAGWKKKTEFWRVDMADKREKGNSWYKPHWMLIDKECAGARLTNTDGKDEQYPAPLATEILEELTYDDIMDYSIDKNMVKVKDVIELFRSPDKCAEIWLEVNK